MTRNDQMTEEEIRIRRAIRSLDDAINSLRLQKSSLAAMLPNKPRAKVPALPPLSVYREARGKR